MYKNYNHNAKSYIIDLLFKFVKEVYIWKSKQIYILKQIAIQMTMRVKCMFSFNVCFNSEKVFD